MSGPPENAGQKQGRDIRGRFQAGASGNPRGKRPGTQNHATRAVLALLDGEAEALTRQAIALALEGDSTALRLCLERLAPPKKDSPVVIAKLPEIATLEDLPAATSAILNAVTRGDLTLREGQVLAGLVEAHGRALAMAKASSDTEDLAANIVPSPHDMEARMKEIQREREEFVPARQEEVRQLKENLKGAFEPKGMKPDA